jgi:hypothetical protein
MEQNEKLISRSTQIEVLIFDNSAKAVQQRNG